MTHDQLLTKKMSAGFGVYESTVIKDRASGKCPCLAPTKHSRLDVMMWQLRPPKAAMATSIGMAMAP